MTSSVENCLSSACLLVGVTLQMKMLRGAQQRKKKEKKNEELKPNPPIHSIAAERRELELYNRAVRTGECQGEPPPRLWAEKRKRNLFLYEKTISNTWYTPQIF